MEFSDSMTLGEARAMLRTMVDEGHQCPVCTQFAKVYKRTIHATMARELIVMYRAAGTDWCDPPKSAGVRGGDLTKTRYWGLLEEQPGARDDGSRRVGIWRVTANGVAWIRNEIKVPKHARVYDGRCLGLTGELISVRDALGDRFDYAELMAA